MTTTADAPADAALTIDALTLDARIAARRAQLQQQLSAIPDDGALPATATREDVARNQQQRADAQRQLALFDHAVATWRTLGTREFDEHWRDRLTTWREVLCDERREIKSPIRDPVTKGRERNLALSLRCIDYGLNRTLQDACYELTTLRLGELMRADGYEPQGADPQRNYVGVMEWHGSLPEVEKRLATLTDKRAQAEANLDAVLMSDEERQRREDAQRQENAAYNAMDVKVGIGCLVAYRSNGDVYAPSDMSAIERRAFERANAVFVAEEERRRTGASVTE
jgi:hypothetical protein